MPWKITEQDGRFCVVKESDGSTEKCHDSKDEAEAHLKALYASEEKAVDEEDTQEVDPTSEEDAEPETEESTSEVATVEVPEGITQVVLKLPAAVAVEKSLTDRIWQQIKAGLGWKETNDEATGFKVVGNHWLATWTNAYKDRDQQFFPEAEIEAYIDRVDTGVVPPPELWVWHGGKQVRVGIAQYVAGHGRFGIAGGEFDKTPRGQKARDYYAVPKHAKETRISHGFTYPVKDFDGVHFRKFNTFEISLLPKGVEANLYTSLEGVKAMKIDEHKREYFEKVFGKEDFGRILSALDEKDKALPELGAEYKDFDTAEETAAAEKAEASELAEKATAELVTLLAEGSSDAVTAALAAVKASKATNSKVASLESAIDELRKEMQLRPRAASKAAETEVETSHLSPALQESLKQQTTKIDPMWGTEVTVTP